MMGHLLLVFCAVGLSRLEHFLVETETEASGEDYASKGSGSREIQHKKSDGGDRKLDTGDQIAEYIDSIKSNLPKSVKDIGKQIGKQMWKEIVELFKIIKSNLPKSISEVKDNPGHNVTIDTFSSISLISRCCRTPVLSILKLSNQSFRLSNQIFRN